MKALNWKQGFLLIILFGLISVSLLAPIASNDYLPPADFASHTAAIVQAKMALEEGQFPIRTAPWQNQGWGNAYYQFYSPSSFMLAGYIYKLLPYTNPFFCYKLTLWLLLVTAAFYCYRLMSWLTRSHEIGILSGAVYIFAPYYLITINTRGDFTEAFAQGLIPVVIYYSLRCFYNPYRSSCLALCACSWFALSTAHLITFVYTSLFAGIFLLLLTIANTPMWRKLLLCALGYILGCLLAIWYLAPIALIQKYLLIHEALSNPSNLAWLTLLPTLFSIALVGAMPLPGNGLVSMPLCFAVGWPVLLATGVIAYTLIDSKPFSDRKTRKIAEAALITFILSFLAIWSPFDFWSALPQFLTIAQFTYRLLTQTMWLGMILFGLALSLLFKQKLELRHVVVGLLLIGLASSSWLSTNKSSSKIPSQIMVNPDLDFGAPNYLILQKTLLNNIYVGNTELPLIPTDNWLVLNQETLLPYELLANEPHAILELTGTLPSYISHTPVYLNVELNGKKISHLIPPGDFTWNLPIGALIRGTPEQGLRIKFTSPQPYIPSKHDPQSSDSRSLIVQVKTFRLRQLSPLKSALPVSETANYCHQLQAETLCTLSITAKNSFVQLPVIYYPGLLNIEVNGKVSDYFPLAHQSMVLTGLKLQPGNYKISVRFSGLSWANWISRIAWGCIGLLLLRSGYGLVTKRKAQCLR